MKAVMTVLLLVHQMVLVLHIFLGIVWMGGVLFIGWGIYPAARVLAFNQQRLFFLSLIKWVHWVFTIAGCGVILTGSLLGIVFGPIRSWETLVNTTYGNQWLAAFTIGLFTLFWGVFIGYRRAVTTFSNRLLWEQADQGNRRPLRRALLSIVALETVEVSGFVAIIFLMVLL